MVCKLGAVVERPRIGVVLDAKEIERHGTAPMRKGRSGPVKNPRGQWTPKAGIDQFGDVTGLSTVSPALRQCCLCSQSKIAQGQFPNRALPRCARASRPSLAFRDSDQAVAGDDGPLAVTTTWPRVISLVR